MTVDEIRQEAQGLAVWDLQNQHFFSDGARRVGDMYLDGTVHFYVAAWMVDDEQIIRPADPYVFRVCDTYHQLYIDNFYDSDRRLYGYGRFSRPRGGGQFSRLRGDGQFSRVTVTERRFYQIQAK